MWLPFFSVALLLPTSQVAGAHLADPGRLWPGGVVEYKFFRSFPKAHKVLVRKAMDYISSVSPCVTFAPANRSSANYVEISPGPKCSSDVGMVGGKQRIFLNGNCFNDGLITTAHQLLHTLGFIHEHSRPDRDDFITLNVDNMRPDLRNNFLKRPYGDAEFHTSGSVNHQHTPYDVLSVLHYGPLGGSKNGEAVINYRYGLPDESWPEPDPHDPYSLIDKVELSLTYGCEVSTAQILQYIHHNRNMNTMMIKTLAEKVAELAEENAKLAQQVQVIEKLNG